MARQSSSRCTARAVLRPVVALCFAVGLSLGGAMTGSPAFAQAEECPDVESIINDANAVVVATVEEVRADPTDAETGLLIVDIVSVEKGGAQKPLAVYYPGETLPELEVGTELDIALIYDLETGRAVSSIHCAKTAYSSGESLDGRNGEASLGESAGATVADAVRTAGLAGAAIIAATFVWRVFREFRPRLA